MTSLAMARRWRDGMASFVRPSGPLPRPSRRNLVFDAVVVVAVAAVAVRASGGGVVGPGDGPIHPLYPFVMTPQVEVWRRVLLALLTSSPLALRRRYPLAVLWTVMLATGVSVPVLPRPTTFYAWLVAAYSAAAYSPFRVPTMASLSVAALLVSLIEGVPLPAVPNRSVAFLVLVPIVALASVVRRWKGRADEERARLLALEREQAEALRRAAAAERARIARELHDVVTHNVSVMVIQAGAARKVLDVAPDQARQALLAVEAGGRAAMADLRHVMGLLTADTGSPDAAADLAPQPGLDRLEALVAGVRDAGLPVEVTVAGTPRPLPDGVDLTAYRVVQEALTNAVKHAVGAAAAVVLDYGADHLRVEVTDTGGRPGPGAASGNGHGLIGLRERVAVYGGTLEAGRSPDGGYRVSAHLPSPTTASASP